MSSYKDELTNNSTNNSSMLSKYVSGPGQERAVNVKNNINQNLGFDLSFSQLSANTLMSSYSLQVISPDRKGSRTEI